MSTGDRYYMCSLHDYQGWQPCSKCDGQRYQVTPVEEIDSIKAERDRYRKALEALKKHGKHPYLDKNWAVYALTIVDDALSASTTEATDKVLAAIITADGEQHTITLNTPKIVSGESPALGEIKIEDD